MFPLHGLPFDLWSLTVKPELCSSNQSGNESLLVLVKSAASSHWQLCTLLSLEASVHEPSLNLNLHGLLHGLLHDTEMLPVMVHQLLCACSP
jgi:hypothetical protein